MRRAVFASVALLAAFGTTAVAQEVAKPAAGNGAATTPAIVITPETTPKDLARAAFLAQGGEKFRAVQNMMLRGSVQLYPPNSVQSVPGSFSLVTAGDKLRMEIDARPAIVFNLRRRTSLQLAAERLVSTVNEVCLGRACALRPDGLPDRSDHR